jgi:hypothetical protein
MSGLKQEDALSPLPFNFPLEYGTSSKKLGMTGIE